MSSPVRVQIGPYTLEQHGEQWRAWRRLEDKERIAKGDEVFSVHETWLPTMSVGLIYYARTYREFRRPVPLPSLGELVEACRDEVGTYRLPYPGTTLTTNAGEKTALGHLRSLLPGYEEHLNSSETPNSSPAPVPAGWRPIDEDTPKDGSKVLLLHRGGTHEGRWTYDGFRTGWKRSDRITVCSDPPTMWLPLPPPPNGGET